VFGVTTFHPEPCEPYEVRPFVLQPGGLVSVDHVVRAELAEGLRIARAAWGPGYGFGVGFGRTDPQLPLTALELSELFEDAIPLVKGERPFWFRDAYMSVDARVLSPKGELWGTTCRSIQRLGGLLNQPNPFTPRTIH